MTLSPGPVALAAVAIWGVGTHLALYGWRPAPVQSVRLSKRQWLIYLAIILPLILVIISLLLFRQPLLARFGLENVQSLLVGSILAIVASIWGLSPSIGHS